MNLKTRTALITGGQNGIGKAIAEKLASEGANIAINGRSAVNGNEIDFLKPYGVKSRAFSCDVSDRKQVSLMVKHVIEEFGNIDILINNAGIYPACPFLETTEQQFDEVFGVNVKGTYFVSQEVAIQAMVPRKKGRIICISSIDGWTPAQGVGVYGASKAAVNNFVKSFALELAPYHITANGVAPGWVATEKVLKNNRWKEVVKNIPLAKLAEPVEIAEVVAFLADEKSSYINGEMIQVNGGLFMT